MTAPLPPDALERAQTVVNDLHEQLETLFARIENGPNTAIRFSAGESE